MTVSMFVPVVVVFVMLVLVTMSLVLKSVCEPLVTDALQIRRWVDLLMIYSGPILVQRIGQKGCEEQ